MKLKKVMKRIGLLFLLLILFMFVNNSNWFHKGDNSTPKLLAHVGMSQTYPMDGITGETCTAKRIFEPEHPYIGNTIPSMEAAFKHGADIVELDVHPTRDGEFAVFHDWTLDCRTDGTGVTREHTMKELKTLDVGYGYTADGGETYPLRGEGVGLMPTLQEVLTHFPNKPFLINIKSNDQEEGEKLAEYLSDLSDVNVDQLSAYGGDKPIQALQEELPGIRVMSMETLKSCLISYMGVGWTGYIPAACKDTQIHIPENVAPWLWGFPNKFQDRMEAVNTRVILVAGEGKWSEGFDDQEDLKRIPDDYDGYVWTNRVDVIAPLVKND
ncbi:MULTISPECIES: glycerophosphodiester phosphodiesterase family protein [Pontibacillus]|uniref:Glycerophosphodiester phosphodiesterase family protein n=1 Tax=Pontibacillus chungwhensis TaxID=265426 RepID=A0ABY8UTA9_9BACI|nr:MULTISPECIES: glycerophosphodiester phosphodiesterase family protein [Pontibacillus]MCD5323361.1 glycerophosphodiester phosphodiesterase [Pontibacillus sp. HN14]WIF96742.1 glycerophosphodiester phosphodiesterase family protein [Pontibacillus chungwhensis]